MQARIGAVTVIVIASCMVPGARAESPNPDEIVKPIFDASKGDRSHACYFQRFTAAHLAQHPGQDLTEIRLLLTAEKVAEDERLDYSFAFHVTVRNEDRLESSGSCGHAELSESRPGAVTIECAISCDGGGVSIEVAAADEPATVRLDRPRVSRIAQSHSEEIPRLDTGDAVFHLRRVRLSECGSLMPKDDELASTDSK